MLMLVLPSLGRGGEGEERPERLSISRKGGRRGRFSSPAPEVSEVTGIETARLTEKASKP